MQVTAAIRLLTLLATLCGLAGGAYMLWEYTRATSTVKVARIEAQAASEAVKVITKTQEVADKVLIERATVVSDVRQDREKARRIEVVTKEVHHEWSKVPLPSSVLRSLCAAWGEREESCEDPR